ncbi:MAG: fructosamine kinase, partial [Bacillaceae bacterium]|nr:fructosamine kinase [Bacillaceae bacterium]
MANLHRIPQEFFGFPEDNYIGILPQKNGRFASWIEYYRECRLLPQIRMAEKKGLLPGDLRKKLDVLLENLDRYLPGRCTPSLLHGDLWG